MTTITPDTQPKVLTELDTSRGRVFMEGPVNSDYLKKLKMNEKLNVFRYPDRQHEALILISQSPEGLVFIARHEKEIIGYVIFHYPDQNTRWSKHPRILELGAIEVSSDWQRVGIASQLLYKAFSHEAMEEYIVISTEFYWHWDLKGTGLDVWSYQKMLTRLFGKVGFKKRRTDDPEILEHPANMLVVRIGSKVNRAYVKAFDELVYQQTITE